MTQQELIDFLKKNEGYWFCSKEIRGVFNNKNPSSIHQSLKKLRWYGEIEVKRDFDKFKLKSKVKMFFYRFNSNKKKFQRVCPRCELVYYTVFKHSKCCEKCYIIKNEKLKYVPENKKRGRCEAITFKGKRCPLSANTGRFCIMHLKMYREGKIEIVNTKK